MPDFATNGKWEARDEGLVRPFRKHKPRGKARVWALTERQARKSDRCEVRQLIDAGILSADAREYRGFNNGTSEDVADFLYWNTRDWPEAHWHNFTIEGNARSLIENGAPPDLIWADYCNYRGVFLNTRLGMSTPKRPAKAEDWGSLPLLLHAVNEAGGKPFVAVNVLSRGRGVDKGEDGLRADIAMMLRSKAGEGWALTGDDFYTYRSLSLNRTWQGDMTTFWLVKK